MSTKSTFPARYTRNAKSRLDHLALHTENVRGDSELAFAVTVLRQMVDGVETAAEYATDHEDRLYAVEVECRNQWEAIHAIREMHERMEHSLAELGRIVARQYAEIQAGESRHDHHETRLDGAGIPRQDADFMAGVEPVALRCEAHGLSFSPEKGCSMCKPSVASLRGEPVLKYLRRAEPVERVIHLNEVGDADGRVCTYPCYRCDRDVFTNEWAENEARRLNIRAEA
jgi:nitrite reductase/ring-hydroxylating ferredoxin subunit